MGRASVLRKLSASRRKVIPVNIRLQTGFTVIYWDTNKQNLRKTNKQSQVTV